MRIKSTAPRDSEDGHSKSLAKSIFSAVLIAGAYILFNPACDAQQEQPVEQAQTQTVSQTATGSPKTAEQAAQSTTPAKPEEQPKKKKKKLGPGSSWLRLFRFRARPSVRELCLYLDIYSPLV